MKSKWKTEDMNYIKEHLDSIEREVVQLRKLTIQRKAIDSDNNQKVWTELMALSGEISERWRGPSAVEEVRSQREKG
jgi:5-bromo-4-chloroindolyl phosphate hydrolysis protein